MSAFRTLFSRHNLGLRFVACLWVGLPALLVAPVHAQPTFSGLQPADGTVLATGQGTLTGTATGAVTLSINGQSVTLGSGDTFSWAFDLPEGQTVVQLYAEDSGGQSASQVHQLVVDTRDPQVSVSQPSSSVIGSQPVQMSGTYFEPHLTSLTVTSGGTTTVATASGGTWSASVPLVEGSQTLTVAAQDSLGHSTSFPVTLTLDTIDPTVSVTESGGAFVGGLFNRPVTPVISVSDATELTLEQVLDGSTFVSGTTVSDEGSHTLDVIATDRGGNSTAVQIDFVIDTTPPAVGTITPAAGTVLAASTASLQIETTGADLVRVTGPGGSVESAGSGLFTVGPVTLAEGPVDLVIEVFDDAGNRTPRTHRLVRDTTPPVLTVSAPSDGDVVAAATVPAQGVAQDARLQSVTVNGLLANLVGEGWSVADVPLTDGSNVLTVIATDSVGNQTTETVNVERDTAAPTFQVLVDGVELVSGATFSGPVSPVIQVDDVQFPGATVAATLDGSTFTSGTEVSTDGSHELSVTVTSGAGVPSSRLLVFMIDQQAPTISEVLPAPGHLQQEAELSLSGTVSGAQVITVDGQAATMFQGSFSAGPFTLAEGTRTFTLVATGANGLETTLQHTVERDSTPPQVAISSPADDALVGDAAITVSGTAIDPNLLTVTVNETPATISASVWNALGVPLREGSTTLTARAEDRAGNVSEVTRTVVLDTEAPQIEITDPTPGTLVPDASYEVRGTVTEEHLDRVDVEVTAVENGTNSSIRATVEGTSFFVSVPLASGTNQIKATARDLLGSTTSDTASIERDADAPQVRIVVPDDNEYVNTASLEVRGTVDNEEGITVRVNGVVAPVELGSWVASNVALSQGENRLLARATDAQGNEGIHTRTVYLDQQAPIFVRADPASGALALPVDAVFLLEFSEPLAEPEDGSWTLTAGGAAVDATAVVLGNDLRITPDAPLPSQAQVVLTLTQALMDRAGNALTSPPAPLVYDIVDVGAPDAVVLDFEPFRFLCASEVVLTGTAEAGARVDAEGGASSAWVRVGDAGTFLVEVELLPERLNRLELRVTDSEGNASPATVIEVVHDCTGPEVLSAELTGQVLLIEFSESVDETTVMSSSLSLSDAAGALAFTVSAFGDSATLTLAAAPAGSVLLDVSSGVLDLAGNPLAYPYRRLFGDASGAESFVSGTVIDDATGRPLAGATVQITATDGVALGEPLPQQTTGQAGRFLIPVSAGTHDLTAVRPGYTPVFRIVTSQAGEGTNVFDPRLTPMSKAVAVGSGGGTVSADAVPESGDPVAQLTLPSGALTQSGDIGVTQLGEQALTSLLPYGWSPRGAVWVESEEDFLAAGTLSLPVRSSSGVTPAGTTLELITLDFATLQWQVVGQATVANGQVTVSVPAIGAYAAVEADSGANAPPAAVVGQVLGSSPSPAGDDVASATLTFDPEVVLPTQRARATATYTLAVGADDAPSGLPLTLVIEEDLELLDGSILRESPYRTDLIVYRDDLGAPSSEFWLKPSETARSEPIQLGGEDVTILPYGDETVRGNVLGPEGGAVVNDEGDRLDIPAGALTGAAAVVLDRQTAADLPLAAPRGAVIDAVVDLDLGGARFEIAAELSIALDTPPAAGSKGLLLQVVALATPSGAQPIYRVLSELVVNATGWTTQGVSDTLPWPGILEGGQLVATALTEDHGYATGIVQNASGQPAPEVVVSSTGVDWVQVSDDAGEWVLPLPIGTHDLSFEDLIGGDTATSNATIGVDGDVVSVDLNLPIRAPQIVSSVPASGDAGVLLGIEPTVQFSEAIDRTTLDDGVRLEHQGQQIPFDVEFFSDWIRIRPLSSLLPGETYELHLTAAIRDLQGHSLTNPRIVVFDTETADAGSDNLNRDLVRLYAPDPSGDALVLGQPGSVPANALVYVENLTSYSTTESVTSAADGSFQLTIGATLSDRLLLHVLIDGSSEDLLSLGPYLRADERAAWVGGTEDQSFKTADGYTVYVDGGTFESSTWVELIPVAVSDDPAPLSAEAYEGLLSFDLSFGGATANKPLSFRFPVDNPQRAIHLLNRLIYDRGEPRWMTHDLVWFDGTGLTSENAHPDYVGSGLSPGAEAVLAEGGAVELPMPDSQSAATGNSTKTASSRSGAKSETPVPTIPLEPGPPYRSYLPGGAFPGRYRVEHPLLGMTFLVIRSPQQSLISASIAGLGDIAVQIDAQVARFLEYDSTVLLPIRPGAVELDVRYISTGMLLFSFPVVPPPEGFFSWLPPDPFLDQTPPIPIGGHPIKFYQWTVPPTGGGSISGTVGPDITWTFTGTNMQVTGSIGENAEGEQVLLVPATIPLWPASTQAGPGGQFSFNQGAAAEDTFFLVGSGKVGLRDELRITFSESLHPDFDGILVEDDSGVEVDVSVEPLNFGEVFVVKPQPSWRAGQSYKLILRDLEDASGVELEGELKIDFSVEEGSELDTFETEFVRDVARLGSWLFVASDNDGLLVLDASDPSDLKNVFSDDGAFQFPTGDSVRGVDIDPHGRVIVVGGGVTSQGQIKIIDPLRLDSDILASGEDLQALRTAAHRGSSVISDQVGAVGSQLPAGTPSRVAVLSNDEIDFFFAGEEPPSGVTQDPVDFGSQDFEVEGQAPSGTQVEFEDLDDNILVTAQASAENRYSVSLSTSWGNLLQLQVGEKTVAKWRAGRNPTGDISVSPAGRPPLEMLTLRGWIEPNRPVTLKNLDTGEWTRADSQPIGEIEEGKFEVSMAVRPGDQLQLIRNLDTIAYVSTGGVGLEVVDIDSFYNEVDSTTQAGLINLLGTFDGYGWMRVGVVYPVYLNLCGQPTSDLATGLADIGILLDYYEDYPVTIPGLVSFRGFVMMASAPNLPGVVGMYHTECTDINGNANVAGILPLVDYEMEELSEFGEWEPERRDLVLVTHRESGLLVYDVTDRADINLLFRIEIDGGLSSVAIDKERKLLYASAWGSGVHVIDFGRIWTESFIDENSDDVDDRILETIELGGNHVSAPFVHPELGLLFSGGNERGLTSVAVTEPSLKAVAEYSQIAEHAVSGEVTSLAPLGVPTDPNGVSPATFRVVAELPGVVEDSVDVEVVSVGPGDKEIYGAGPGVNGPWKTRLVLSLERQAQEPWQEGYQIFSSGPVTTIADLRASSAYQTTPEEEEVCPRCYHPQGLPADTQELLSGHKVLVRFTGANRELLGSIYGPARVAKTDITLQSVPWDVSPSLKQEPLANASYGMGEVVPGTLLHSGEFTTEERDISILGRGLDFVFERFYRSGTIGSGPLGPGWEYSYRTRVRSLPNLDVEYYDGHGRRHLFKLSPEGYFEPPEGLPAALGRSAAGFVVVDPLNNKFKYDNYGRLVSVLDRNSTQDATGSEIRFHYDEYSNLSGVTDTLGRNIVLQHDSSGKLISVEDFSGRTWTYEYDSLGRLETVESPEITEGVESPGFMVTTYSYESPASGLIQTLTQRDNLTSITDGRGVEWMTLSWSDLNADGILDEIDGQTWGGDSIAIEYDFGNRKTSVTDRRGKKHDYIHNSRGQVVSYVDPNENETRMEFDDQGRLELVVSPSGSIQELEYASGSQRASGAPVSLTTRPGSRGQNEVGPDTCSPEQESACRAGQVCSCILESTVRSSYNSETTTVDSIKSKRGNSINYSSDDRGLPNTTDFPDGSFEIREHNVAGQVTYIENALGEVTEYFYFDSGPAKGYLERVTVKDVEGDLVSEVSFERDGFGRVTATTDGRGVRSENVFNEMGWIVETRSAVSGAGPQAPPLNIVQKYVYDLDGNEVKRYVPYGDDGSQYTVIESRYGYLGELEETEWEITPGGERVIERLRYDGNRNLVEVVNPRGFVNRFTYDDRGQRTTANFGGTEEQPGLVTESYTYDVDGNLTQILDGRGNAWSYSYDGHGRLKETQDPLGNRTTVNYDRSGNQRFVEFYDSAGSLLSKTETRYDEMERKVAVLRYDLESSEILETRVEYDLASNPYRQIDAEGRVTKLTFDALGRVVEMEDPVGNRIEYLLDATGNIVETTSHERLPDGSFETIARKAGFDALGRVISQEDALGNVIRSEYDVRSNVVRVAGPEGNVTVVTYDGLDRRTSSALPSGIRVTYEYDENSNLKKYTDGLGQTTEYFYDALDRLERVEFADGTAEEYTYDATSNLETLLDANGSLATYSYDEAGRMLLVEVAPGTSIEGSTTETVTWDGLSRPRVFSSGSVTVEWEYDSLSRLTKETILSRSMEYEYSRTGSETARIYPSGLRVETSLDDLDRPEWMGADSQEPFAAFEYLGRGRLFRKELANGQIQSSFFYDAAGRQMARVVGKSGGLQILGEEMVWSPRSFLTAVNRTDFPRASRSLAYDEAGRVVESATQSLGAEDNSSLSASEVAAEPRGSSYRYDVAQNLVEKAERRRESARTTEFEPDSRNRPGSSGVEVLEWDGNGNLKRKGDTNFHYDFRDRLVRVSRAGQTVAAYEYDGLNRRVRRTVGQTEMETVWSGWQAVEEYRDDVISKRRVFGLGIDEIVRIEKDLDGNGSLETVHVPVYDHVGNVAAILAEDGTPLERYDYDLYGNRRIFANPGPQEVEQVRIVGGELWLELGQDLPESALDRAVDAGAIEISRNGGVPQTATVQRAFDGVRELRRRLIVTTTDPPIPGDTVELSVQAGFLEGAFHNPLDATLQAAFTWPAEDGVVEDQVAPRLAGLFLHDGFLLAEFSEPVDPTSPAILVDGSPVSWMSDEDGYGLISTQPLLFGTHSFEVVAGALDLFGNAAGTTALLTFDVSGPAEDGWLFVAPEPGEVVSSTVANDYGFHGRPVDTETGLYYFRNRYYDAELGRFVTTDPYGYADGPSMYQFALNNPVNFSDPTGEIVPLVVAAVVGAVALQATVNIAVGMAIEWVMSYNPLFGDGKFDYTLQDAGWDFALGAMGRLVSSLSRGFPAIRSFIVRIAAKETFEFGLAMGEEFVHGFVAGENLPFKDLLARATLNYGLGKVAGAAIGAGGRYLGSLGGGLRHRNVRKRGKPTSPEPGKVGRGGAGRNQDLPTKQVRQCKVNCFSRGTRVATEEGSATIETLEAGDRVWAFDEISNKVELRQILQTFSRQRDGIYVLSFGDETIRTTSEHPFFVEDRGWVEAEDLEVGDLIRTKSGEPIRLDMIEIEEGTEQVFNFSVEGLATYFVGNREVLVHNCGPRIANKLPVDHDGRLMGEVAGGRVRMNGDIQPTGEFDFVVRMNGDVLLGRKHSFLSGGADVQAAGVVRLRAGNVVRVDNASGHYLPTAEQASSFLRILGRSGLDIRRATLEILDEAGRVTSRIHPTASVRNNYE